MRKATMLLAIVFTLAIAGSAMAAQDGTLDGTYGPAIVTQETQTQFGDANIGLVPWANGSELDAAYAYVSGGNLYLFLSGNLESNFNKLELYFDTKDGGQNVLLNTNPDVDFNGLNRQAGLTFDAGFDADYYLTVTGGDVGGGTYKMFGSFAELLTLGGGAGGYLGEGGAVLAGPLTGGTNPFGIEATINNSNAAGVGGGCAAASGAGVTTGVEFVIPLAAIGSPTGCFDVVAFVNGSGHDFLSNQVLGALPAGTCNLGDPAFVNFSSIAGNQYFQVCGGATPNASRTWGSLKTLYR